jgi:predicted outer membrane repeat protein
MRSAPLVALLLLAAPASAQVIHVDDTAVGANDGTSWQDAFTDLQSALAVAGPTDVIWVARGTYKPTATLDRSATFDITSSLHGGFDGTETSLADRAGLFDETILSGDLLGNDGPDFAGNDENSAQVLSFHLLFEVRVLDGFTVQGGNANIGVAAGGGIYVEPSSSRLVVRNCTFRRNHAHRGGAISAQSLAVLDVERCTFFGNHASTYGGAIAGEDVDVRSSRFVGNLAGTDGGGLWASGTVADCVFSGNVAGGEGGGAFQASRVWNCTFSGNVASIGGGISGGDSGSPFEIANAVLWGNHDATGIVQSGQIAGHPSSVVDCVVQGLSGLLPLVGTFSADPLFRSPLGADGIVGTLDDDLRLQAGSPCIDSARATGYFGLGVDSRGRPRFVDSLGCDGGGVLDRGAIERQAVDGNTTYCDSTPSSTGIPAVIGGPCTVEISAGAFAVLARPIPDGRAFLMMGEPGTPLPFGNGSLCLSGRIRSVATAIPNGGTATFLADPVLLPGATVGLQVLFRDSAAGGAQFNLSSAMRLLALP